MDHKLTPQKQDSLVEQALKTLPLEPLPGDVTPQVIARIKKDSRPAVLGWRDLMLVAVIAGCIWALWFAIRHLPSIILEKFHIQGILLYQGYLVNARWLFPVLLLGLALLLVALIIPFVHSRTNRS